MIRFAAYWINECLTRVIALYLAGNAGREYESERQSEWSFCSRTAQDLLAHFVGSILGRELAAPGARASQRNRHWPDT